MARLKDVCYKYTDTIRSIGKMAKGAGVYALNIMGNYDEERKFLHSEISKLTGLDLYEIADILETCRPELNDREFYIKISEAMEDRFK